jgi:hypothetical protein
VIALVIFAVLAFASRDDMRKQAADWAKHRHAEDMRRQTFKCVSPQEVGSAAGFPIKVRRAARSFAAARTAALRWSRCADVPNPGVAPRRAGVALRRAGRRRGVGRARARDRRGHGHVLPREGRAATTREGASRSTARSSDPRLSLARSPRVAHRSRIADGRGGGWLVGSVTARRHQATRLGATRASETATAYLRRNRVEISRDDDSH